MKTVFLTQRFEEGEAATEYVKNIAGELVEEGHEAAVVAFDDGSYYEVDERVEVHRVDLPFDGSNIYNWSMMMNNELKKKAKEVFGEEEPDIIHTIDWMTVPGGISLSKHLEVPLVTTFQSTENQRGFEGDHAGVISELEWEGSFEANMVIATNEDTRNSLLFDLEVPEQKMKLIDPFSDNWQRRVLKTYRELLKNKEKVKIE